MANLTQTISVTVNAVGATPYYPEVGPSGNADKNMVGTYSFAPNAGANLDMKQGQSSTVKVFGSNSPNLASGNATDMAETGSPQPTADRLLQASEVLSWASSNPTVASVPASGNPAVISAVGVGSATITVTYINAPYYDQGLAIEVGVPS